MIGARLFTWLLMMFGSTIAFGGEYGVAAAGLWMVFLACFLRAILWADLAVRRKEWNSGIGAKYALSRMEGDRRRKKEEEKREAEAEKIREEAEAEVDRYFERQNRDDD